MLEIRNLACTRGDHLLFSNLNFTLSAGEILQVQGVNGSGKTTLLRTLCGLVVPTAGQIDWLHRADHRLLHRAGDYHGCDRGGRGGHGCCLAGSHLGHNAKISAREKGRIRGLSFIPFAVVPTDNRRAARCQRRQTADPGATAIFRNANTAQARSARACTRRA